MRDVQIIKNTSTPSCDISLNPNKFFLSKWYFVIIVFMTPKKEWNKNQIVRLPASTDYIKYQIAKAQIWSLFKINKDIYKINIRNIK